MAKLSSDGKSVTIQKGDTLWDIAREYLGAGIKYKQLAAINNIPNPNRIAIGTVIKLTSDGSSVSSNTTNSNKPTINQFGLVSNEEGKLFATWTWSKSNTKSYKVLWTYETGNGVWFGKPSEQSVDENAPEQARQSEFSIPANAKQVRFKVLPISKEKDSGGGSKTTYWTANWSDTKTYTDSTPLEAPSSAPSVEIKNYKLTASLDNVSITGATAIQFQVVKNNSANAYATKDANIVSAHASYEFTVDAGGEYKVRCRAINKNNNQVSDWTQYSNNVRTIPATPSGITTIRASSETSVYLEWTAADTAESYNIEYATKKEYFDGSDQTQKKTGIEFTHFEVSGLESGTEYFFRVSATNSAGDTGWSEIKSVVIGSEPAAPTTWSSTTTAITGEPITLYWVHNTEDGSKEKYADLELYIDGVKETHTIQNGREDDDEETTSSYVIDTSSFVEGSKIQWRVRTSGITNVYGDWSVQRTIDIYAPATLEFRMTDIDGNAMDVLNSFPFYFYGLPGPNTQAPIGYHLTVTSNSIYETVDNLGNPRTVNEGEQVYSKYFDVSQALLVEMTPGNIDLENGVEYTASCTVSMDSGLTAEASLTFTVSWEDEEYHPDAEIGVDEETYTAYIRPYCENRVLKTYRVELSGEEYVIADEIATNVYGESVAGAKTTTGEQVYSGVTIEDEEIYYCQVEERVAVEDVLMSVYRREFDGSFTEIATGLDSSKYTTVTDPHPALDLARYRIVATSKTTGAVSYYDPPGHPVDGNAVIIQWDEAWSSFDTTEEAELEQPPWSGSLLKLPYNIDVSDNNKSDVALIEYIGRSHPISYYGTQLGQKATWNMTVEKSDEETLYGLRRLARWMGDVYVREPSGSGYWANISVSFSQKHCDVTIPVTLDITRVEGGI